MLGFCDLKKWDQSEFFLKLYHHSCDLWRAQLNLIWEELKKIIIWRSCLSEQMNTVSDIEPTVLLVSYWVARVIIGTLGWSLMRFLDYMHNLNSTVQWTLYSTMIFPTFDTDGGCHTFHLRSTFMDQVWGGWGAMLSTLWKGCCWCAAFYRPQTPFSTTTTGMNATWRLARRSYLPLNVCPSLPALRWMSLRIKCGTWLFSSGAGEDGSVARMEDKCGCATRATESGNNVTMWRTKNIRT